MTYLAKPRLHHPDLPRNALGKVVKAVLTEPAAMQFAEE